MSKENRIKNFVSLQNSFSQEKYQHLSYSKAQVLKPDAIKLFKQNPIEKEIIFFQGNILEVMQSSSKAAVLVFCSAKNPGGGILRGSRAQEEDISLHSTWYFQVKDLDGFYLEKGASSLNTDNIIYIEKGYLLKDLYNNDIVPVPLSFIGSTAVNLNGLEKQGKSTSKYHQIMSKRIERILQVAQNNHKKELILGAFGCGVFGGDPQVVATIFNEKIKEGWFTGKIIFAIMDNQTMEIFKKEFKF